MAGVVACFVQHRASEELIGIDLWAVPGNFMPRLPIPDLSVARKQEHVAIVQLNGKCEAGIVRIAVHLESKFGGTVEQVAVDATPLIRRRGIQVSAPSARSVRTSGTSS